MTADVSSSDVMSGLQARVRERLRHQLRAGGSSGPLDDPAIFADVERLLQAAVKTGDAGALLLPELLGDPETWRVQLGMHVDTHRAGAGGAARVFVKRRLFMPVMRWLFEYSRDNFERQRRVNDVLFACVQELAAETARLRQELQRRPPRE